MKIKLLKSLSTLLMLVLFIGFTSNGHAAAQYSHNGNIDPLTEGWTFLDTHPQVTVGPVTDNGINAWSINDFGTVSPSRSRYNITPTTQEISGGFSNGWILRVNLRVVDTPDDVDPSILAEYNDGSRRFLLLFGSDNSGDPVVQLVDGVSTNTHTVTGGGNQFNLYELVFVPSTGRVSLFVNNQATSITDQPGIDAGSVPARINWGSGSSATTGHAYYNLVEWEIARDSDGDFIIDYLDNCTFVRNFPQTDTGGIGSNSPPDGIGDECQCGDLTGDGTVNNEDLTRYRQALADPENNGLNINESFLCGVYGDADGCNALSVAVMERAIGGNLPEVIQSCAADNGDLGSYCGDFVCDGLETCTFDGCQDDCGKCTLNTACTRNEDCASNICDGGTCSAPPISPNVPFACGDTICGGSESCTHVGKFGCFDDCGPCQANANPNDGIQPDYCLEHRDCSGDQLCVSAGECINTNTDDSIGILCAEDADCPQGDFTCNFGAFNRSIYSGIRYEGLCSDLQTTCFPVVNLLRPNELQQAECSSGDLCYRRKICHEPGLNTPICGSPTRGFAERCNVNQVCAIDDDCISDTCYTSIASRIVRNSFCIPPNSLNGFPCNDDNECTSNSCFLGFCTNTTSFCLSDSDCASDERCAGFPGTCNPSGCGDGLCSSLEACHVQPMNPPSFIETCQEDCGKCITGHSCGVDSDCISGDCNSIFGCQSVCGDGVCDSGEACTTNQLSPLNNLCRTDCGACANGFRCNTSADCVNDCVSGICAPTPPTCNDLGNCPNGGICTASSQCASGRCLNNPFINTSYCVPSGCIAPGSTCSQIDGPACCDFPDNDLSCRGLGVGACAQ